MRAYAVHTVESLLARTVEEGDCLLWQGYVTSKTPQVDLNGKMVSVRKLLTQLQGKEVRSGTYFSNSCGNYLCVCPEHTVQRSRKQHSVAMGKAANSGANNVIRLSKITAKKRATGKLDMATARQIREQAGTYRDIARQYGVSHALVGFIKRGRYWKDQANPFAGLMR